MNRKNVEKIEQGVRKQERQQKQIRVQTDVRAGEGEYSMATQRIELPDGRIVLKMS
jgi:hypothetical protein